MKEPLISRQSGRGAGLKSHPARPDGEAAEGEGVQRLLPYTELNVESGLNKISTYILVKVAQPL